MIMSIRMLFGLIFNYFSDEYGQNPENPGMMLGFVLRTGAPSWTYSIHTKYSCLYC